MKKWRSLLLSAVVTLGIGTAAFAQMPHHSPALPFVFKIDKYKQRLGLSETQVSQLDIINRSYKNRHDASRQLMKPYFEQIRTLSESEKPDYARIEATMKDLSPHLIAAQLERIRHQKEILAVLTPQQRDIMRKMRQDHFKHASKR